MMAASITPGPLTRRSSERELADGTSKKRATSASGLLNRNNPLQCKSLSRFSKLYFISFVHCSWDANVDLVVELSVRGEGL